MGFSRERPLRPARSNRLNQATGEKYQDRNTVVAGVTKDMKEWAQWGAVVQDPDDGLEGAMTPGGPTPSGPTIDPPPWAD